MQSGRDEPVLVQGSQQEALQPLSCLTVPVCGFPAHNFFFFFAVVSCWLEIPKIVCTVFSCFSWCCCIYICSYEALKKKSHQYFRVSIQAPALKLTLFILL